MERILRLNKIELYFESTSTSIGIECFQACFSKHGHVFYYSEEFDSM